MTAVLRLFGALAFGIALVAACRWLLRALSRYLGDPTIDTLISANRSRFRANMGRVDWSVVERAGKRRWYQTLRAQGRATDGSGVASDQPTIVLTDAEGRSPIQVPGKDTIN